MIVTNDVFCPDLSFHSSTIACATWCAAHILLTCHFMLTNPSVEKHSLNMSSTVVLPSRGFSVDVFYNILMFIGVKTRNLVFLWTTCREVSREFKDTAERVFVSRHIKKPFLKIAGGT